MAKEKNEAALTNEDSLVTVRAIKDSKELGMLKGMEAQVKLSFFEKNKELLEQVSYE